MSANVLLVEDDREQVMLFARVLETAGYAVVSTETAEDAQARLSAASFDLLLADWDLGPGRMQGDALIRWAKARDPHLKAILFSNHYEVDEIAAASGADASFRKVEGIIPLRRLATALVPVRADHA